MLLFNCLGKYPLIVLSFYRYKKIWSRSKYVFFMNPWIIHVIQVSLTSTSDFRLDSAKRVIWLCLSKKTNKWSYQVEF